MVLGFQMAEVSVPPGGPEPYRPHVCPSPGKQGILLQSPTACQDNLMSFSWDSSAWAPAVLGPAQAGPVLPTPQSPGSPRPLLLPLPTLGLTTPHINKAPKERLRPEPWLT